MSTVSKNNIKWLQCQVDQGMFSDEVAVTYPSTGVCKKSVFVPSQTVRKTIGKLGEVQVSVIPSSDGTLMAMLPSSSQDIVVIARADISE